MGIVGLADVTRAVAWAGAADRVVCLHASLSSFGHVEAGAATIVDAFLASRSTLLVPTFSWSAFAVAPPPGMRPARNGTEYNGFGQDDDGRVFTTASDEIDVEMGAVAAAVLRRPGRCRGNHPLCSFAAVGPHAADVTRHQSPLDVFAPLEALARADGLVILAGVGLNRMTLLHHAEHVAGRVPLRRWARTGAGSVAMVAVGGCSAGFEQLSPELAAVESTLTVGPSGWRVFPARPVIDAAAAAIVRTPMITHCDNATCTRCNDIVAGGPCV